MQDKFELKPRKSSHCNMLVGKHHLNTDQDEDYFIFLIREFKVHPKWNPSRINYDGDIAVAILESPITFQQNVKPICLPIRRDDSEDIVGKSGVVAGWGYNSKTKTNSGYPKIVKISIASEEECLKEDSVLDVVMSHRSFCSTPNIGRGPCKGRPLKLFLDQFENVPDF